MAIAKAKSKNLESEEEEERSAGVRKGIVRLCVKKAKAKKGCPSQQQVFKPRNSILGC